jgi:hypothetical protein
MGVTSTAGAKAYAAVFINSPETTVVIMSEMQKLRRKRETYG